MALKPEIKEKIQHLLTLYPERQAALLPSLHAVQDVYGYVSPENQGYVAEELDIPIAEVREVISFYTMFFDRPVGKYNIQVCHNISCSIMGIEDIITYLEEKLSLKCGETSEDGRFTLMRAECLGACDGAPMFQLNDKFQMNMTREKIDKLLDELS